MTEAEEALWPLGRTIVGARKLTAAEMEKEGWDGEPCSVLVLGDGGILYPSRDPEGNGPGALFGVMPGGATVAF